MSVGRCLFLLVLDDDEEELENIVIPSSASRYSSFEGDRPPKVAPTRPFIPALMNLCCWDRRDGCIGPPLNLSCTFGIFCALTPSRFNASLPPAGFGRV